MAQFKVYQARGRARILNAPDLEAAARIADLKYPKWTDIYIQNRARVDQICENNFAKLEAATL